MHPFLRLTGTFAFLLVFTGGAYLLMLRPLVKTDTPAVVDIVDEAVPLGGGRIAVALGLSREVHVLNAAGTVEKCFPLEKLQPPFSLTVRSDDVHTEIEVNTLKSPRPAPEAFSIAGGGPAGTGVIMTRGVPLFQRVEWKVSGSERSATKNYSIEAGIREYPMMAAIWVVSSITFSVLLDWRLWRKRSAKMVRYDRDQQQK